MNLHVSRNFSLRSIPVTARRPLVAEPVSDPRAALAAQFIPAGACVLDLSANKGLQRRLPVCCTYRTYDAGRITAETVADADIVVILGTLERLSDPDSLFAVLGAAKRDVVLSYCARDFGEAAGRLSYFDLTTLFDRHGYRTECTAPVGDGEMLMRLMPTERFKAVSPCRVAVISGSEAHNFGARLGRAMIQSLLPGEAEVDYLTPATLSRARAPYDLAVLGTGAGLMQPLIDDGVAEFVGRAKAAIGIFGVPCRALIPRAALDRLLERLDTWYARYQDDALIYGRGRNNVVHLGDWVIDRFPLGDGSLDEPLQLAAATPVDGALDRAVADIQRHRRVYSEQLHPLLCALTAAETAAYADRPAAVMPGAEGQFRSMLIDVFGRTYPEKEYFLVDRDAVRRYKARVHGNVAQLGARIGAILHKVATAA